MFVLFDTVMVRKRNNSRNEERIRECHKDWAYIFESYPSDICFTNLIPLNAKIFCRLKQVQLAECSN